MPKQKQVVTSSLLPRAGEITITLLAQELDIGERSEEFLPIVGYGVRIEKTDVNPERGGSWHESFGSPETLQSFFRGLQAMSRLLGGPHLDLPEIPKQNNL